MKPRVTAGDSAEDDAEVHSQGYYQPPLPSQVAAGEASTTAADAPHPTTVRVVIADDIVGTLSEFRAEPAPARDANGGVRLMTDGAGLISHDLARLIPAVVAGRQVAEMLYDDSIFI